VTIEPLFSWTALLSPSDKERRKHSKSSSNSSIAFTIVEMKDFLRSRVILACIRLRSRLTDTEVKDRTSEDISSNF
jgi:hypothetical protein